MTPGHLRAGLNRTVSLLFSGVPGLGRLWGRWAPVRANADVPWTPLTKPLRDCRATLVTTGGVHLAHDTPFDMMHRYGDPTFREIPADIALTDVRITHDYYDHRDADRDVNIVFPLDRFRELVQGRAIKGLTWTHFSFMGHVAGPLVGTLEARTIPRLLARLRDERPDFVFLTPARGLCHQSVGLIQRAIEANGVPTVSVSLLHDVTEKLRPPRAVCLRWPFGHPLGEPFARAQQLTVIHDALALLYTAVPGVLVTLPYRWRRERYAEPTDWELRAHSPLEAW
jgi:D-proline reductase (dithiol) PrdB